MFFKEQGSVTPSRVCELKLFMSDRPNQSKLVTPSRVCELKLVITVPIMPVLSSHPHGCVSWNVVYLIFDNQRSASHPHGCVSWNLPCWHGWYKVLCHTLTGVWVEIVQPPLFLMISSVTPSRVCELKYLQSKSGHRISESHPHGCVSWNFNGIIVVQIYLRSHPHGCVSWNLVFDVHASLVGVTPSRVCELK